MKKPPCALRDAGLSPPPSKLRRYPVRIIIASSLILLIAIPIYIWRPEKRVVKAHMRTSIGIYTGQDPFRWRPAEGIKNPVITPEDVTDVDANTVADPFMVREGLTWYMFFEVKHAHTRKTSIALATSGDGLRWTVSLLQTGLTNIRRPSPGTLLSVSEAHTRPRSLSLLAHHL